ncbi:hypothetical protein [Agromyces sp. C10]|uniref:hypothetical protein n=1 Tax=Agromyces sp. C10 TaxID=2935077 RepID=UPI00200B858F|nr:hypothetical protein [Agromyces sp. C10]MCK8608891.1 hypothetical protein [Agromyces sp. C10]
MTSRASRVRDIRMPKALHDVFGEVQSPVELALVVVGGLGLAAVVCLAGAESLADVAWWRAVIAVLLVADICCGAVANFTRGTDRYYAERPRNRWVFIAVHWHLVVIALALGEGFWFALAVTAYTLVGASAVNLLHGSRLQQPVGGLVLAFGLAGVVIWAMTDVAPLLLLVAAALFLLKVAYAFAVAHHPAGMEDPLR